MVERQYARRESGEAQIAVLIDYENVGLDSIQDLFDQLSDVGRIMIKRAYADWAGAAGKRDQLLSLGIEAVHHFRSAGIAKNSSDIALVIDAVDLLHSSPVDTFAIVSSDSDFVPLVSKLRAAGKAVIGAGRSGAESKTLVTACDRYIYLNAPEESAKAKGPTLREQAEPLLVRAVNASADSQGQVRGAKLHHTMIRLDPSFDFKALGFKTFTQFLRSCRRVRVSREGDQGDVTVELASTRRRSSQSLRLASGPEVGQPDSPSPQQDAQEVLEGVKKMAAEDIAARQVPVAEKSPPNSIGKPSLASRVAGLLPFGTRPRSEETSVGAETDPERWDLKVDNIWSKRSGAFLPGPWAASEAARVLNIPKLSTSRYKTLQGLLDASDYLKSKWRRDGNAIIRRGTEQPGAAP